MTELYNVDEYVDYDFTSPCDEYIEDNDRLFISSESRMIGDSDLDLRCGSIREGTGYVLWFEIIKSSMKPFLRYRLERQDQTLVFEKIKLISGKIPEIKNATYNGLYEYHNEQYLFFTKQEDIEYIVSEISSKQKHFYVMAHDRMNLKKHFGLNVSITVTDFFMRNEKFIFLEDENDRLIEIPITGYRGDYYKKVSLMAGLGMPRSGPYASLGPFYYFGSYDRSLRYAAITMNGKPLIINGEPITVKDKPVYTKGGIVKYALFIGCSKVMLNLKSDPKDSSYESLKIAKDRKFIKDTLRIRDTYGTWISKFSSVIQPELELYDRDLNIERTLDPQFVVKSYEQQFPLEYAYYKTDHITKDPSTDFYNTKDIIML